MKKKMKKNEVTKEDINFLKCVVQNSVDLRGSSAKNAERIERALAIVDKLNPNSD